MLLSYVAGLYTAPTAGTPMVGHDWVEVAVGAGVLGDRYALGLGHWSDPRWPDQEVTLVEIEVAEALAVDAGALRRNIVTRGLRLDRLIGASFHIGEIDAVELEGVRPCDPCGYLEELTRPGLASELRTRGGLRARVLRGGRIAVGDRVYVGNGQPDLSPGLSPTGGEEMDGIGGQSVQFVEKWV